MTKLFLHIGLPKTGSTAIQRFFYLNQEKLQENGILYPRTGRDTSKEYGPNHQELVNSLIDKDQYKVLDLFDRIDFENEATLCNCIFLSHEGMTNHFYDFDEFFCTIMQHLSKRYELNIVLGTRSLEEFFFAYYKQNILNPPINNDLGFGSSYVPLEFLRLPRIQLLMRYDIIIKKIQKSCPDVTVYLTSNDDYQIIQKISQLLGISVNYHSANVNQSLSDYKIELLRRKNKKLSLGNPTLRAEFITNVRALDDPESSFSFRDKATLRELRIISKQLSFPKDVIHLK